MKKIIRSLLGMDSDKKFFDMYFKAIKANKVRRLWLRIKMKKLMEKKNSYIGFAPMLFQDKPNLPHGLHNIHIAKHCKFGKNITIFQNVTVGQSKEKYPIIGDNVVIGAGAIIIGDVKIGNNVRIGADTVVTFDVPDNCTVVGQKAKIILKDENYWVNEY